MYIGARIVRPKIRENFVRIKQNMCVIHTSKSLGSVGKHTIVQITIVQIIRNERISEGQIIWAILYTLWDILHNLCCTFVNRFLHLISVYIGVQLC